MFFSLAIPEAPLVLFAEAASTVLLPLPLVVLLAELVAEEEDEEVELELAEMTPPATAAGVLLLEVSAAVET